MAQINPCFFAVAKSAGWIRIPPAIPLSHPRIPYSRTMNKPMSRYLDMVDMPEHVKKLTMNFLNYR
jgi:hypothetical protein